MKYTVDENCVRCGACTVICPSVFSLNDGGQAVAIDSDVPAEVLEDAEDAMGGCPVGAIRHME